MTESNSSGFVIWLTGLPASGKTLLAHTLKEQLALMQIKTIILDSDKLRTILTPQPTYSEAERDWFYGVVASLAAWIAQNGLNVLIAATAPRRRYRDQARQQINRFAEIYVQCALEVCQQRDPKGIYARAKAGQAQTVPGVGVDYEPPLAPETAVDTTTLLPPEAAQFVIAQLQAQSVIGGKKHETQPELPHEYIQVQDRMTGNPITATPSTTLVEAHRLMHKANIRHLPIVVGKRLVSLLTLNDVRRAELEVIACYKASGLAPLVSQLKTVGEMIRPNPTHIHPNASIAEAARLLLESKLTALPVVAEDELVGIITESDIFRLLSEMRAVAG